MNRSGDFTSPQSGARTGGSTFDNIKTTVVGKLNDAADMLRQKTG
jgi:hypothetical protein